MEHQHGRLLPATTKSVKVCTDSQATNNVRYRSDPDRLLTKIRIAVYGEEAGRAYTEVAEIPSESPKPPADTASPKVINERAPTVPYVILRPVKTNILDCTDDAWVVGTVVGLLTDGQGKCGLLRLKYRRILG